VQYIIALETSFGEWCCDAGKGWVYDSARSLFEDDYGECVMFERK